MDSRPKTLAAGYREIPIHHPSWMPLLVHTILAVRPELDLEPFPYLVEEILPSPESQFLASSPLKISSDTFWSLKRSSRRTETQRSSAKEPARPIPLS